jgi:hypothetical protein
VLAVLTAATFWLLYGLIRNRVFKRPLGWSGDTPLMYFGDRMVLTTVQVRWHLRKNKEPVVCSIVLKDTPLPRFCCDTTCLACLPSRHITIICQLLKALSTNILVLVPCCDHGMTMLYNE